MPQIKINNGLLLEFWRYIERIFFSKKIYNRYHFIKFSQHWLNVSLTIEILLSRVNLKYFFYIYNADKLRHNLC